MTKQGTLQKIRQKFMELLFEDITSTTPLRKRAISLLRLGTHMVRELSANQCPQRAAALSYTTVLSLVPVTALFVLYFKMAGKLDAMSANLQSWILRSLLAESAQEVGTYIDQFVANLNTRTIGTVGVAGLLITTYLLFRTIERSFNDLWKVRSHRSFIARFQMLSSLLIILPTFLVTSIYVSGRFQALKFLLDHRQITGTMRTLFVGTPFFLTAAMFFILFKLVPNTQVKTRPALVAAFISALLFEVAKGAFNFYVSHVLAVSKIYGSLGLVPVLLLWIYFSWLITLFGVEFCFTTQNLRSLHEEALVEHANNPLSIALHEEWGLTVTKAFVKLFASGSAPVSLEEVSRLVAIPPPQIEDHLEILIAQGIVGRLETPEKQGFVFLRPVHRLTEGEILNTFRRKLQLPDISGKRADTLLIALT